MPKATKQKVISTLIRDRADLERVVRETAELQLQRETLITERDRELKEISDAVNPEIDEHTRAINDKLDALETWADGHLTEFGKDRSILVNGNRIGWRTGQPTPKPRKKHTWKSIVADLTERGGALAKRFLRTKIEPDKEAMLAARHDRPELLDQINVEIVQSETFYLDPAREGQPDKRLTKEAA